MPYTIDYFKSVVTFWIELIFFFFIFRYITDAELVRRQ